MEEWMQERRPEWGKVDPLIRDMIEDRAISLGIPDYMIVEFYNLGEFDDWVEEFREQEE